MNNINADGSISNPSSTPHYQLPFLVGDLTSLTHVSSLPKPIAFKLFCNSVSDSTKKKPTHLGENIFYLSFNIQFNIQTNNII